VSVADVVALVAAFGVTAWFVRLVVRRDRDAPRHAEDEARAFFDEHGHWPDETPADAEARRRRGEAAERAARAWADPDRP
jgi:hypothetical protein